VTDRLLVVGGILSPLEDFFREVLIWFHDTVGLPWSWSIVAITICVRFLLVPIVIRQIHSMQNLQAHAPEMKELQQKWKHDKQRQNEELMKFYRENKINPAASCLPMIAQIPVFLGLYYTLDHFEDDLSIFVPGTKYFGDSLDWLNIVNIAEPVRTGWGPLLVVVYVISQFTSSWYMTSTTQGAQRYLILGLPLLFAPFVLVYNFPAGLMIYWLTTNLWTTGQGFITRRLNPKPAPPEKRSSRTSGKDEPEPPPSGNAAAKGPGRQKGPGGRSSPAKKPAAGGGAKPVAGPPRRVRRKRGGGPGR
jgi:YidC/Oxa1 family membrane protein insertase